jgi:hypothetical protein
MEKNSWASVSLFGETRLKFVDKKSNRARI